MKYRRSIETRMSKIKLENIQTIQNRAGEFETRTHYRGVFFRRFASKARPDLFLAHLRPYEACVYIFVEAGRGAVAVFS